MQQVYQKVIEAMTNYFRKTLNKLKPYAGKTLNILKAYSGKSAGCITTLTLTVLPYFPKVIKRILSARALWLFTAELAGIVLVTFGISLWSVPAALIIGGLVLVGVVEVRPHVGQRMPRVLPPEQMLRAQAENAAIVINSERYGLGYVDQDQLASLTVAECERVIMAAKAIGATKT